MVYIVNLIIDSLVVNLFKLFVKFIVLEKFIC